MARLTSSLLLDRMCRVSVVINVLMCVGALCLFCLYLSLPLPALWSSYVAFYSVHAPGLACMTVLYGFVCVVQRSICHLFGVKGWPTFSRASALCSGWVGRIEILYMTRELEHPMSSAILTFLHCTRSHVSFFIIIVLHSHLFMLSRCLMIDC